MRRRAATLVMLLLIAILPLRAIAAMVVSVCGAGHQQEQAPKMQEQAPMHQHGDHGATPHQDEESSGNPDHSCGYCAKHCTSAAVVLHSEPALVSANIIVDAIPFNGRRTPGFLPNQLDRPPLAF